MLEFLRKYQRYFFSVIAVVIIISFSFFGTFSTIGVDSIREGVAFTAIDGTEIKRTELDDMVAFLSTDAEDKLLMGGIWGPNFLNDGVIKIDILQRNLAPVLAEAYKEEIHQDLQSRLDKEKRFPLYVHPQAKFISVESAWTNFAPYIKNDYDALRQSQNAMDPKAFEARVRLYLNERQLPSPLLRQVLRYQEKQYGWINPDPMLDRIDLSLFGYHTADDWFGPRFIRITAEFIINGAKVAEGKGYSVSNQEVLADLMRNSESSYRQNVKNPNIGVANSSDYFNEQLRRLGMDEGRAMKTWRQVLLFRRLFGDVGNAVIVDPLSYQKFNAYSQELVEGDIYRLPKETRIGSFNDLQKLEIYLSAVSNRGENPLAIPTSYLTVDEVTKKYPELVQKRYLLEVSQANKTSLQSKVSVKDTWNWEVEDKNWAALKKQFPDLGIKKGDTRDERFSALDSLDDKTRSKVDVFARASIVDSHPEWLTKALDDMNPQRMDIGLRSRGGTSPFAGLENREDLIKMLDAGQDEKLNQFTADNKNYYRIKVIEKAPKAEVMTFAEANKEGVLDQLRNKELEAYYTRIREGDPAKYQKEDKSWKPFSAVQDQIAELYYAKVLKAIQADSAQNGSDTSVQLPNDLLASKRLASYAREIKKQMEQNPNAEKDWVASVMDERGQDSISSKPSLENQWKLEKAPYKGTRGENKDAALDRKLFDLGLNQWSEVYSFPNGEVYFVQVKSKGINTAMTNERVNQLHQALSNDAQHHYMIKLVKEIKDKGAISLNYMNAGNAIYEQVEEQQHEENGPF